MFCPDSSGRDPACALQDFKLQQSNQSRLEAEFGKNGT